MTLRTIEEEVFEKIRGELPAKPAPYNLTLENVLTDLTHPRVLRAEIEHNLDPVPFTHPIYKAAFYATPAEAKKNHPEVTLTFSGMPHGVWSFMQQSNPAIIDFPGIGTGVLSQSDLRQAPSSGIHLNKLSPWVTYALSPELWGPQGKWTRFHQRLSVLFKDNKLLQNEAIPGFYSLKAEGSALEKHGFRGSNLNGAYVLQMNWTFPLSGLSKLEETLSKGK